MEIKRYYSVAEAARVLGVSLSTLERRLQDGSIPFIQPGGKGSRGAGGGVTMSGTG